MLSAKDEQSQEAERESGNQIKGWRTIEEYGASKPQLGERGCAEIKISAVPGTNSISVVGVRCVKTALNRCRGTKLMYTSSLF